MNPSRDTCAQLKDYVDEFHPRLLGLTGCPEQLRRLLVICAARAARVL